MDVIEASHLQAIRDFLENHPGTEFKMRKTHSQWTLAVIDVFDETGFTVVTEPSFIKAIRTLNELLKQFTGVDQNGSTNAG